MKRFLLSLLILLIIIVIIFFAGSWILEKIKETEFQETLKEKILKILTAAWQGILEILKKMFNWLKNLWDSYIRPKGEYLLQKYIWLKIEWLWQKISALFEERFKEIIKPPSQ